MRIEVEMKRVLESIYALSAMQGYVNLPERERALLEEDQQDGLKVLATDAFMEIVAELMPMVTDFEAESGSMWIELKDGYLDNMVIAEVGGNVLAKVTAHMVLSAIYEGSQAGAEYWRKAKNGLATVRGVIESDAAEWPRLRGWR